KIGTQCLIGINSVVMDGCEIGPECIVGALTFVKGDSKIPARSMVVGNPGRIIGEVSDKMIDWKRKGTALYQKLPARLHETLKACDPLHEITAKRVQSQSVYRPWSESKD
ncbi:MAG: gamma carbonic anhydrase family protein, partial [Saprospiraceae bacterium]|nr:gamma carbonic anhydrase family protein [Saprospiraceae bacterium]